MYRERDIKHCFVVFLNKLYINKMIKDSKLVLILRRSLVVPRVNHIIYNLFCNYLEPWYVLTK